MHPPSLTPSAILALTLTLLLPSLSTALTLPNVVCNHTSLSAPSLQARGCTMLPLDSAHFSSASRPKPVDASGHPHPQLTRYRIHGGRKEIEFDNWGPAGAELPNFDDVIELIDKAEDEMDRIIKSTGHDGAMPKRTVWKFGTASLAVTNDQGSSGGNHRDMKAFLWGLREFGMEFGGFWETRMRFVDWNAYMETRAKAILTALPVD